MSAIRSLRKSPVGRRKIIGRRGAYGVRCLAWFGLALAVFALPTLCGAEDAEVLPPHAVVREAPDPAARAVATLPGGMGVGVVFTQRGPDGEWARVSLPSGQGGFVREQSLRRLTAPPVWRETGAIPGPGGKGRGEPWSVPLRRAGGLFLVAARINGAVDTLLLLDTGASDVSITSGLAERLGITRLGPPRRVLTANGVTLVQPTLLESIYLPDESGVCAFRVEASVGEFPGFPPEVGGLLGQTFLKRFRVSIDAERLVLHLEPIPQAGQ